MCVCVCVRACVCACVRVCQVYLFYLRELRYPLLVAILGIGALSQAHLPCAPLVASAGLNRSSCPRRLMRDVRYGV